MSDARVLAVAVSIWIGCVAAVPVPWWVGGVIAAVAFLGRQELLLIGGALLLGMSAGSAAEEAYEPMAPQPFDGVVQIVSLPEVGTFAERAEAKLPDGRRVSISVSPGAGSLRSARAGEKYMVVGAIRPVEGTGWDRSRHIVGLLSAVSVHRTGAGSFHWRTAAALQRTVERAAELLPGRSTALYNGLVTGDDREQGAGQRAVFRSVGLSHVLAVSGQNVAFVLVILHVVVGSVPGWTRPTMRCGGLVLFALITQMEPSVLRATVTAAIGYWTVASGRRTSGARLLALAVGGLLLIDPFLTESIGFQLSVLASLGILVLGPLISNRLPGPVWIRVPIAVTLSAQILVSPLLIASFGSVSLVSIPANVLVGGAVGAVMVWGMSVGLLAGLVGGSLGAALVVPVRPMLWWIDAVARYGASAPSTSIDFEIAAIGLSAGAVLVLMPGSVRWFGIGMLWVALMVLGPTDRPAVQVLDGGGTVVGRNGSGTVLVLDPEADDRVVAGVLAADVGTIDVVIVRGGHRGMSVIVRELRSVVPIELVIGPPQHTVVGARRTLTDAVVPSGAGPVVVRIETPKRLDVELPASSGAGAGR